ncbi:MAG TPA: YHS domain-containing protein [Terriglobales bacterium]|nr:YHS domain-containing protein [Terriglobales bacterium]
MAIDPVCKMEVKEEEAAGHTSYDGADYYFCSRDCEDKFTHSPGDFLKSEEAA